MRVINLEVDVFGWDEIATREDYELSERRKAAEERR